MNEELFDRPEVAEEEANQHFTITDDSAAEWALGKIKEAAEERDRLMALVEEKKAALDEQADKITVRYERDTNYLRYLLQQYMGSVKCKSTKTQDTYQLLTGKLVRKHATTSYEVDKDKLLGWLKENRRDDLIKVETSVRWADVKKLITGNPDTGLCVMGDTGEVLEGVTAVQTPEKFEIKF